jgi:hypothetical protein
MFRHSAFIFVGLVISAAAQTRTSFTIDLPQSVVSEKVVINYCLYGPGPYCSWVQPKPNVSVYTIETRQKGHVAYSLKAVVYAPGCAMETVAMSPGTPDHVFSCRPLPSVTLTGELAARHSPFDGHPVELQATYLAPWARQFFGTADGPVLDIPVGPPVDLGADNHFSFALPDFASDPVAAAGFLHIWVKEKGTGKLIALLVPDGSKTKIDNLPVEKNYPANMVFTPCIASESPVHDHLGFAIRGQEQTCAK